MFLLQKNIDIVPDPGWLAGTYEGNSGWFPESFVEPLPAEEYVPIHISTIFFAFSLRLLLKFLNIFDIEHRWKLRPNR